MHLSKYLYLQTETYNGMKTFAERLNLYLKSEAGGPSKTFSTKSSARLIVQTMPIIPRLDQHVTV